MSETKESCDYCDLKDGRHEKGCPEHADRESRGAFTSWYDGKSNGLKDDPPEKPGNVTYMLGYNKGKRERSLVDGGTWDPSLE